MGSVVKFTVRGKTYLELRRAAEREFRSWLNEPNIELPPDWSMEVEPDIVVADGTVQTWRGEVEIPW